MPRINTIEAPISHPPQPRAQDNAFSDIESPVPAPRDLKALHKAPIKTHSLTVFSDKDVILDYVFASEGNKEELLKKQLEFFKLLAKAYSKENNFAKPTFASVSNKALKLAYQEVSRDIKKIATTEPLKEFSPDCERRMLLLMKAISDLLKSACEEKGIKINYEIEPKADGRTKFDPRTQMNISSLLKTNMQADPNLEKLQTLLGHLKDVFIIGNTWFVKLKARPGVKQDDFLQAGKQGLVKALNKFDISMENDFTAYAKTWIKNTRQNDLQITDGSSAYYKLLLSKLYDIATNLRQEQNRTPSAEEIVEEYLRSFKPDLDTKAKKYKKYRSRLIEFLTSQNTVSLNADLGDGFIFADTIPDKTAPHEKSVELKDLINQYMSKLSEGHRQVLTMRFGLDGKKESTVTEIAQALGITNAAINLRISKAIAKLQAYPRFRELAEITNS